jgi:hypothetical protein
MPELGMEAGRQGWGECDRQESHELRELLWHLYLVCVGGYRDLERGVNCVE